MHAERKIRAGFGKRRRAGRRRGTRAAGRQHLPLRFRAPIHMSVTAHDGDAVAVVHRDGRAGGAQRISRRHRSREAGRGANGVNGFVHRQRLARFQNTHAAAVQHREARIHRDAVNAQRAAILKLPRVALAVSVGVEKTVVQFRHLRIRPCRRLPRRRRRAERVKIAARRHAFFELR